MAKLQPTDAMLKASTIARQLAEINQLRNFLNLTSQHKKDLSQIRITGFFKFPGPGPDDQPENVSCNVPVSLVLKLVGDYYNLMAIELERNIKDGNNH